MFSTIIQVIRTDSTLDSTLDSNVSPQKYHSDSNCLPYQRLSSKKVTLFRKSWALTAMMNHRSTQMIQSLHLTSIRQSVICSPVVATWKYSPRIPASISLRIIFASSTQRTATADMRPHQNYNCTMIIWECHQRKNLWLFQSTSRPSAICKERAQEWGKIRTQEALSCSR